MTREEEIQHKAGSISDGMIAHYVSQSECKGYYEGYIDGANWADNHPVNSWHKTSEELPEVDKHRKCIKVFARREDDVFVAFYSPIAGFNLSSSFYTEYILSNIEYWMPIPELPKE